MIDDIKLRNGRLIFAAAMEKLTVAKNLRDNGYLKDALSRAYYAAFHAVSLLLFLHGQSYSRHGQLIGAFNREFIATGKLPKELGKAIVRLFDQRQTADYDVFEHVSQEEADQSISDAEILIAAIKTLLETEFLITLEG
jgi:uncharacterized protein (UPF0332 family)